MTTPNTNDGGPAFPRPLMGGSNEAIEGTTHPGMSLRDWFAGQALTGIILSPLGQGGRATFDLTVRDAYSYADAMLAAREKGSK